MFIRYLSIKRVILLWKWLKIKIRKMRLWKIRSQWTWLRWKRIVLTFLYSNGFVIFICNGLCWFINIIIWVFGLLLSSHIQWRWINSICHHLGRSKKYFCLFHYNNYLFCFFNVKSIFISNELNFLHKYF